MGVKEGREGVRERGSKEGRQRGRERRKRRQRGEVEGAGEAGGGEREPRARRERVVHIYIKRKT